MSRWAWFFGCAFIGLMLLLTGWLVPAHLRAVDVSVLQEAGRKTPALAAQGLALANQNNLGAARLLLRAGRDAQAPGLAKLALAVTNLSSRTPRLEIMGAPEPRLGSLALIVREMLPDSTNFVAGQPFTELVVRLENRDRVLKLLQGSSRPVVQELLWCRSLTNTVIFPPASSSSGQAFDAAVAVTGLLLDSGRLGAGLSNSVMNLARQANTGGHPQPLEQVLLDTMSLGQRFNWGQLVVLLGQVEDPETLRFLAHVIRRADGQMPSVFAAVAATGRPDLVARYLMNYSRDGYEELGASLRYGVGGVKELVSRNQRLYRSNLLSEVVKYDPFGAVHYFFASYAWLMPWFTLGIKWFFYLAGGFMFAAAFHYGKRAATELEAPLQVRGFHFAREFLFSLGFLVVMLLLTEPFIAHDSQKIEYPFRLRLPAVGSAVAAGTTVTTAKIMNQLSLLTLLLFFVLQGLIYTACLVKLAEIRRQKIGPRMKLKLLENEDHLFDAGLYLGFVGTIISLILVSLGVIKPSLMAAYSSTSFGIIFVSVFKIFHLRPVKRNLILEAESQPQARIVQPGAPIAVNPA